MKTINNNQNWIVSAKATESESDAQRPKIGDDDGISNEVMNGFIILFMLITVGLSIVSGVASANNDVKDRILIRQAMLDMDRLKYEDAIIKLLEVRANTEENANVNYMLGMCYLNGEISAEKAVFYLSRAVTSVSPAFEEWDLDERNAPVETAYYLAKAYEKVEDFAMAADFYEQFLNSAGTANTISVESRTYAMINKSAQRCEAIAQAQQIQSESIANIVFNK